MIFKISSVGPCMIDVWKKLASDPGTLKRIIFSSGVIDPVVAMHGTEAAVHAKWRQRNARNDVDMLVTNSIHSTVLKCASGTKCV